MTISSPQPGIFISRPSWIGSAAIDAAHSLGNNNTFPTTFRRADATVIAALLAIEEAYWERAYWFRRDPGVPAPQYAVFSTKNEPYAVRYASFDDLAYPTAATGYYSHQAKCSTPQDRAFSTRRIYRPALEWMLKNFLWSPIRDAPFFANFLRDQQEIHDSTDQTGTGSAALGQQMLSSSALGDTTPTLPSFSWVAPQDVISTLASWRGGHTLDACANDGIFRTTAPDPAPGRMSAVLDFLLSVDHYSEDGLPEGWRDAFILAHQLPPLGSFGSILSAAFGTSPSFDYSILRSYDRRLRYERLAAYSQAFAAMDRLYTYTNWPFEDTYHNNYASVKQYKVTGTASGTIPASALDWSSGRPVINPGVQVSWGSTTFEDTTTVKPNEILHGNVVSGVQSGKCVANTDSPPVPLLQIHADEDEIKWLFSQAYPQQGDAMPFTISPPSVTWSDYYGAFTVDYEITRTDTGWSTRVFDVIRLTPPTGTLPVTVEGVAEYDYWDSILATPNGNILFPGPRAWQAGVVREVELCGFFAQTQGESIDDVFSNYDKIKKVRAANGTASSQSGYEGLFLQWQTENIERARSELAAVYPFTVANLPALQSRLSAAIGEAKHYVEFSPEVSFTATGTVIGYMRRGPLDSDPVTIQYQPATGGLLGSFALNLGTTSSASRPVPNMVVGIKSFGNSVRIDWNFNTLRLTQ